MHQVHEKDYARTLCAVLLNPALKEEQSTTTYRNVSTALPLLRCTELVIANLICIATKDAPALNLRTLTEDKILESRRQLTAALSRADEVLVAWGMGGMTGSVRTALRAQVDWLGVHLSARGVGHVWTLAGRPRHPSRWRQYVGPEKQRVEGRTFEERLQRVLMPVSLTEPAGQALLARAF